MEPIKIFEVDQIRRLDAYTIEYEPISSIDLMERASIAFVNRFCNLYTADYTVRIYVGLGNNGGDGLAIGRLLAQRNYNVKIFLIWYSDIMTADFHENISRLPQDILKKNIRSKDDLPQAEENSIAIDALLGTGLSRETQGLLKDTIDHINQMESKVVSVDIASGLFTDSHTAHTSVINPDYTIAFQMPKLAFLLPENFDRVGKWYIEDIGLSYQFIQKEKSNKYYLDKEYIKSIYKKRNKFSHKGSFGKALLVAGSFGKMGAAVLAARGCLRAGVGLLTVQVPKCGTEILQSSVPEAMVLSGTNQNYSDYIYWKKIQPDVIGIGPGLGKNAKVLKGLRRLLQEYKKPIIFDADAINLLAENSDLLDLISPNSILTPHFKEFERLVGKAENDFHRLEQLLSFAKKYNVFIVLKGMHSVIANPMGELYFNSTGNPGMATGGSGDVLTGIITSLLGQGYTSQESCLLGVYIHGLAADLAAVENGEESLLPSDIISFLGKGFLQLQD